MTTAQTSTPSDLTRVLLVEDNIADADLIREHLTDPQVSEGYHIEHVSRLSDAVERLAHGGVEVVLLDLGLPDSHGLDSVARIVDVTGAKVPVVVLTGFDDEDTEVLALRAQADDYLVKGMCKRRELRRSIQRARERRRRAQGATATSQAPERSSTRNVLIVDEDPENQAGLSLMLRLGGCVTTCVSDWFGAISEVRSQQPDLILFGPGAREEDSIALERFRELKPGIPIVVLMPVGSAPGGDWARAAEDVVFLPKPSESSELLAAIESAIQHGAGGRVA